MPFRYYTDEGALIRGEFDNSDNLQRPFDVLTPDGEWATKAELMPSPYHAVQCTEDTAKEFAEARLGVSDVKLDADPVAGEEDAGAPSDEEE